MKYSPTRKLYYENAYTGEFNATVISSKLTPDGVIEIITDATVFFPEAGGQSADTGILGNLKVTDVRINNDGVITHYCAAPDAPESIPAAGEQVKGSIDWQRRHSFMQHHTAEHIFSGLVNSRFGYDNVGFHLSDHICTMDYNGVLSEADVSELERECSEWIYKNVPVSCYFPAQDELDMLAYRCKGELAPPVRIVEIEGVDVCACCAPHVKSAGEIGILKVLEANAYKGGTRLTIVSGRKALCDYQNRFRLLGQCKNLLSSEADVLPERIQGIVDANNNLRHELDKLNEKMLMSDISTISRDEENAILFSVSVAAKAMRSTVNTLMEQHRGICGVFSGTDKEGYEFILGSKNIDMRSVSMMMKEDLTAKCGGSDRMIQGRTGASRDVITKKLKDYTAESTCSA